MPLFKLQCDLAEHGFIVSCDFNEEKLWVGKPSSLIGRQFEDFDEQSVTGFSDNLFKSDAPFLTIQQRGKGRKTKYYVDMSVAYAPAPKDKVWFRYIYKNVSEMIADVVQLFLGNNKDQSKIMAKDVYWQDEEQTYFSFTK